ncbi:MAG: hypothetical protein ACXVCP_08490 [Bdellovibrio sp.]
MAYFFLILKRNTMLVLTAMSLFLCSVAVLLMNRAVKIAQDPILIAIDSNSTRVISRIDDPIFDTEAVQFIKMFVSKLYNFTPKTFEENVGYASTFFSLSLWEQEEAKLQENQKTVEKDQISMTAAIQRISKNSDSEYTIDIKLREITRLNTQERNISLKIFVERTKRSKINPYGIEVTRYEENILN